MLAVASSKMKISGSWANILANANNCFWPAEKDSPRSFAISSIPSGRLLTNSSAEASFNDSHISSFDNFLFNFILSLILLAKINGSWRTVPICLLKSLLFISFILTPSNKISPFWTS